MPPYLLERIARTHADEEVRGAALDTLARDATLRTLRAIRLSAPTDTAATATVSIPSLAALGQKQVTIYDSNHTEQFPSTPARSEGASATGEQAVDEAYDGLSATYDFYWTTLQRDSIDDKGMPLNGYVHFSRNWENAAWDGQEMLFGDGDGVHTNGFTVSIDIMGHELTHGVTERDAQLIYNGQSGALNESVSDVFGSLVKQYKNGKESAEEADWLIGEGIFTEQFAQQIHGNALRSMKEPGHAFDGDPQPAHMRDYVRMLRDHGGVHSNSGIPNKAFYLVATGLGGYAGEKAGPIWYATLRDTRLTAMATFKQFAQLTAVNAENLFPGGDAQRIVREAWEQVGISI